MKILSGIINNKDIVNKEYLNTGLSSLEQRILALENDKRATEVPIGTIISYASSTPPEGYLKCEGQEVSRTTYSQLFNAIGTTYGAGDGSTTFNVPDLRGEFLRGAGTNSHQNQGNGETVGTHQDGTQHMAAFGWDNGAVYGTFLTTSTSGAGNNQDGCLDYDYLNVGFRRTSSAPGTYTSTSDKGKTYTSRPTNTSVLYCIKYKTYSNIITIDDKYPVGSIYISVDSANPSTLFGGTWEAFGQGRMLIGSGTGTDDNSVSQTFAGGSVGGEYKHTLTEEEMPKHTHRGFYWWNNSQPFQPVNGMSLNTGTETPYNLTHTGTASSSKGGVNALYTGLAGGDNNGNTTSHNIVSPYVTVYMWKRTA